MGNFNFRNRTPSALAALLAVFLPTAAAGEINLDRLAFCDDIAEVYRALGVPQNGDDCRRPSLGLESELIRRSNRDSSQLCMVPPPPGRLLQGFSCVKLNVKKGAFLSCFRSASKEDVEKFKESYKDDFVEPASRYMSAAAQCRTSNGDSSYAPASLFPPVLALISRYEFGYVVGLGKGNPADANVIHGYASLDPALSAFGRGAIEFVNFNVGTVSDEKKAAPLSIGEWLVTIDEMVPMTDAMNEELRKRKLPVKFDGIAFELNQNESSPRMDDTGKLHNLESLQDALTDFLIEEGFERMSDSVLEEEAGFSAQDFVAEVTKRLPFGSNRRVTIHDKFNVLLRESPPSCARSGKGAMGAYVFAIRPAPLVKSDFGEVSVMIIGIGACSSHSRRQRTYVEGLTAGLKEQATSEFRR